MPMLTGFSYASFISRASQLLTMLQFQDKYTTKRTQGGEALADELLIRIREYLRSLFDDADSLDILVRVYANLEGIANFLVRQDKVRNLGSLRAMATGFCGRISSFDWIDVGVGKEGSSGRKVRGLWNMDESYVYIGLTCYKRAFPSMQLTLTSAILYSRAHRPTFPRHYSRPYPSTT